jgi:hypothetical protein
MRLGNSVPLFGTPRSPDRPTLGGAVAEAARRLGKPLMPHQRMMADVALELDPETGLLAFGEVIVIGPRQGTGKTELMLPVMTHRCVGFDEALVRWVRDQLGVVVHPPGPQRVLYTAQTADAAREKWRDVHLERLKGSPFYKPRRQFGYRLRLNQEAMVWENRSMWSPGATTGKTAGTGDTLDVGVIDEGWSRPNNRTELGMRPTMLTRPWRQLWVLSMIPGLSRVRPDQWPYLRAKRQLGRQRVAAGVRHGMAFFDFTAAEGLDPQDPETWYSCMPGLGRTVPERAIREDFDSGMPLVDLQAEYLGWEPVETSPRWTLVSQLAWDERYDPASGVEGRPALAVEMNEERDRGWIGVAGYRPDGQYHVEVAEPGGRVPLGAVGVEWLERRTVDMVADHTPWTVVVDPRRPAASLIQPLKNRGIDVLTPAQPDIAGACGRFFDATGQARDQDQSDDGMRLHHLGQLVLDRAMGQARRLDLGGGAFVFVRKGTSSELGPLYVCTLALHGLVVKGSQVVPEPDIFV